MVAALMWVEERPWLISAAEHFGARLPMEWLPMVEYAHVWEGTGLLCQLVVVAKLLKLRQGLVDAQVCSPGQLSVTGCSGEDDEVPGQRNHPAVLQEVDLSALEFVKGAVGRDWLPVAERK